MQHQEFEPSEILRDTIKCYWYNRWDADELQQDFEVQPDGYAEIIFYFGSVLSVKHNSVLERLPSPFMMGLLNEPLTFHAENKLEIIGIRCFPWTVFDLLGLPAGKDGLRIFEHPIASLQSALNDLVNAKKINEVLYLLQDFLIAINPEANNNMLLKAGKAMRETGGIIPVSEVAAAAHATVRTLERNFKRSSGYSVKDVSGLMRFEQVRNHLWHHPGANLVALAHEFGYADQPHLSKEFKKYSGTTPASFARKAKTNRPVLNSDIVAFVQA